MALFDQLIEKINEGKIKPLCDEYWIQRWINDLFQNENDLDFLIEELIGCGYLEAA